MAQYYSKWDAPANERVYPLRIPDVILTGGLYPVHINQYTQFLKQENMLFLDASELMDNPGKVMREVAQFVGLPPATDIPIVSITRWSEINLNARNILRVKILKLFTFASLF